MKSSILDEIYSGEFLLALKSSTDIETLYQRLNVIYKKINLNYPWLEGISVKLDETQGHLDPWYYDPELQSHICVTLSVGPHYSYIFKDSGEWNLNDHMFGDVCIEDIVNSLMNWDCFIIPLKVIEVKKLILNGSWRLDPNHVPKLSTNTPKDIEELISWDENCVLTATNKENMSIITREQWDEIIVNETQLFMDINK